jgi:hypothetical protein
MRSISVCRFARISPDPLFCHFQSSGKRWKIEFIHLVAGKHILPFPKPVVFPAILHIVIWYSRCWSWRGRGNKRHSRARRKVSIEIVYSYDGMGGWVWERQARIRFTKARGNGGNVIATDVECEDEWPGPRTMVFEPSVEEPE